MTDLALVQADTGEVLARESGPLAQLRHAHAMLEAASTLDEVKGLRDKAESLRHYCEAAGLGLVMQNRCAELKLRAERKAGLLLADMPKQAGARGDTELPRLSDIGVAKHQSSRWQRVASLPEDDFEEYVADTVEAGRELTTAGALQRVRAVRAQDPIQRPRLHVVAGGVGLPGLTGQFCTIVADPPWQYGNTSTRNAAEKHYPTMPIEELCDLPVEAHAAESAHLYLWATAPLLREAFDVMAAWGFTYKTNLVWVKPQIGMGNYFRVSHEHVLFGIRGSAPTLRNDVLSWFQADRAKHSAKPDAFLDIVESSSPGPGLEMFARRRRMTAFDWSYWGNEA